MVDYKEILRFTSIGYSLRHTPTIEVYDSVLQGRLNNDAGYEKLGGKDNNGRSQKMFLSKEHTKGYYQYDGYFDSNGEFCIAFHTYAEDYVAVRDSEEWSWNPSWTKYSRFTYGTDKAHNSLFAPLKASSATVDLLNQCIR